ncbi:hypothetical protein DSO57_1031964 [Entomophthora muscae]|uniref:Uncharacterized protein n=1 Tax=Entomophthora muscae TaxID=34485 RepID=A0ACC2SPJ4_9FUNG|nr:hypothetical protein DSO57_1031964 [Entomophthora muscae]
MFINSSVFKIIHDSLEEFGYQNVLHELKGVLMGSKAAGAETIEKVALLSLQLALDNPQYSGSTLPELELLAKAGDGMGAMEAITQASKFLPDGCVISYQRILLCIEQELFDEGICIILF